MPDVSARVETSAAAAALWPLVRDLAARSAFLPAEGFRDIAGDRDRVTMQARVPRGWTQVEGRITGEIDQVEVRDEVTGDGIALSSTFRIEPGAVVATVSYRIDGVPRIVERTVVRPLVQRNFESALQRLVAEAERGGST